MENLSNKFYGLKNEEANIRLLKYGYNELPDDSAKNKLALIIDVISEPMLTLLFLCGLIYIFIGNITESLLLLFSIFAIMAISFYQKNKAENTLTALKKLASPGVRVIREGKEQKIPSRELVPGDIMILSEGGRISADGKILNCVNLTIDESFLTGESFPVNKRAFDKDKDIKLKVGGNNQPYVFSGCLVNLGHAVAEVTNTGVNSQMGIIGKSIESQKKEKSLLQKETEKLIRIMFLVGLLFCTLLIITYGFTRGNWLEGFLAGLTLAIGAMPEELPIVLTLFMVMGAWRLTKQKILTRDTGAIETLGSATVLCVDKTGTITQNKMSIGAVFTRNKVSRNLDNFDEDAQKIIRYSVLASQKNPFDPMERAFVDFSKEHNIDFEKDGYDLVKEYPLDQKFRSIINAWKKDNDYLITAKGSPEDIISLAHIKGEEKEKLDREYQKLAQSGLRVLAVARSTYNKKILPENRHDFNFEFLGFIGLYDPIRENISKSIQECFNAKIRVIMLTGDYPSTAQNIAKQIGLISPGGILTGDDIEKLSKNEFTEKIKNINIFSRVLPEQKLLIIQALKSNSEIVAMTGDGVNDAPALKAANIGISMGHRGTDVAREASSIVLLDDDFSSIVDGVRTGRRIYDNLKKVFAYIFAVHIPIFGMSLLPVFFGWPLLLLPANIVFLELIIDPACSLAFEAEPEEKDIMNRYPRKLNSPIFNKKIFISSMLQGAGVLITALFIYKMTLNSSSINIARTLSFSTLVLGNLLLILANKSWNQGIIKNIFKKRNITLATIIICAFVLLILIIYTPGINSLFTLEKPPINYLIYPFGATIFMALYLEIIRVLILNKEKV